MTFLIFLTIMIHFIITCYIMEIIKCFVDKPKIKYLYWKIMYSFIMLEMIIYPIYALSQIYNEFIELLWKTKN